MIGEGRIALKNSISYPGIIDRRQFLRHMSRGVMAASLAPPLTNLATAAEAPASSPPVKSPVQKEATKQQESETGEGLPLEKRVGFALVGLGR